MDAGGEEEITFVELGASIYKPEIKRQKQRVGGRGEEPTRAGQTSSFYRQQMAKRESLCTCSGVWERACAEGLYSAQVICTQVQPKSKTLEAKRQGIKTKAKK